MFTMTELARFYNLFAKASEPVHALFTFVAARVVDSVNETQ